MKVHAKENKIFGRIFFFLGVLILAIYILVAIYYENNFFPKTVINGLHLGNVDQEEATAVLESQLQEYSLDVIGRDLQTGEEVSLFHISAEDLDLSVQVDTGKLKTLLKQQNNFLWPVYAWRNYDYNLNGDIVSEEIALAAFLDKQAAFNDDYTTVPKDAHIQNSTKTVVGYEIVPEEKGTRLDRELAETAIHSAIADGELSVNLEEQSCYLEPTIISSSDFLQQSMSQVDAMMGAEIIYDWNNNQVVLSDEQIREWIVLKDNQFSLDKTAVKAFVEENALKYDTYGKDRVFRTTLGYDLILPSGAFGWLTDCEAETNALIELIEEGAVTEREPVYASKAPWKGINDIGNSYVEADMTHQHLYLYQKGTLVLETDFVSGDMSKNYVTPEGVFGITYKTTNAVLRGGDYAENVTYWMPYHGNYGMHDATWREEFGGDIYLTNGSHGCLNLPLDKAGEIYGQVSEGFPVICYYYPPGVLPVSEGELSEDGED